MVDKPYQAREPDCRCPGGKGWPASACRFCKDGAELRAWSDGWRAWLAENPDSPEAITVRAYDRAHPVCAWCKR